MTDDPRAQSHGPEGPSRSVPHYQDAAEARRATRRERQTGARQLRDIDSARRARTIKITTWSFLGGVVGGLLGVFGMVGGQWGIGGAVGLFFLGWFLSFIIPVFASNFAGAAATRVLAPSGSTTPHKREYSMAESLLARGLYDEGIAAFEEAIVDDPSDPVPYLKVARVLRDRMGKPEDAASWFKRVLREPTIPPGAAKMARRELVELFVSRMNEPQRALPILARAAEELSGSEEGAWAEAELARVRALVHEGTEPA